MATLTTTPASAPLLVDLKGQNLAHSNNTIVDASIAHDGGLMHYRLEGNPSLTSPTLVFINEALVNFHIWDPVVTVLKEHHPEYRFLRYDIRGYSSDSLGQADKITLPLLANDLRTLFSHLQFDKVHSLIGLGLGASIALAYLGLPDAEKPAKVSSFVGISFPLPGSQCQPGVDPFQPEADLRDRWDARKALAARVGMGITGDKAVSRWFTADARNSPDWVAVRDMVAAGSKEGMGMISDAVVESAVWSEEGFNARGILAELRIPSLFISGAGDKMLPEEMKEYPRLMQDGLGRFEIIYRANRASVYERADEFVRIFQGWFETNVQD